MRALVYDGPWRISIRDQPDPPRPKGDEVIVAIRATGICGTDLGIISGHYAASAPVILGHEACGVVTAVGPDVKRFTIGNPVVIDPTYSCGTCFYCSSERSNHCARKNGTEAGVSSPGTLATLFATHERFLYHLPTGIPFEYATLAEPLSCVLTGAHQLRRDPNLRVLILGAGPIGLLYASVLSVWGMRGAIVEASESRRGAAAKVLGERWQIFADIHEARHAFARCDIAVETTGQLGARALTMLDRGGQFLAVGLRPQNLTVDVGDLANRSISIIGSIDSAGTFEEALSLIASGQIPVSSIVTHCASLDDLPAALSLLGMDVERRALMPNATALKLVIRQDLPSK